MGDEWVLILTPEMNTEDPSDVMEKLPLGELTLLQRRDFIVRYQVVTGVDTPKTEVLLGKFDNDSSILIYDLELVDYLPGASNTQFKISMLFSCKLYDTDGNLKGEIKSGDVTGIISLFDE